ncbi:hypothetical protein IQ62_04575 [Streptomyces scabiei]|nr:hypothetical protein IQ62_04575 [Streptomyces scabiei]
MEGPCRGRVERLLVLRPSVASTWFPRLFRLVRLVRLVRLMRLTRLVRLLRPVRLFWLLRPLRLIRHFRNDLLISYESLTAAIRTV